MNAATEGKRSTPFAPGFGTRPDYVAGRKEEFQRLGANLHDIVENRQADGRLPYTAPTPIVLIGPRGVGKTLLLGWVEEQARNKGVHIARFSQMGDSPDGDMMERLSLIIAGKKRVSFLRWLKKLTFSVEQVELGVEGHRLEMNQLMHLFEAKLKKQPMVLLMDEVQHYHAKFLGMVLQAAQELIVAKYPLMVLLAGTPEMSGLLMNIKASFLIRSEEMYINLLEDEDVMEGLKQPFVMRGVEVEESALYKMRSLTDGYPYFIQTVGDAVWNVLQKENEEEKQKKVDLLIVEKARRGMEKNRKRFYSKLHREMEARNLHVHALQIGDIIKRHDNKPVSREVIENELDKRNKELLQERSAKEVVSTMLYLGFLWPDDEGFLSPGIPSFLSFLEKMEEIKAQQQASIDKTWEKQQQVLAGAEEEPDLLDVTRYINAENTSSDKSLMIKVPLELGEEWNIVAERGKIHTVVFPNSEKGTYRVNRIEDHRDNPYRDMSSFTGIILHLGAKTGEGFDDTGMHDRPDVESWQNKSSTRR